MIGAGFGWLALMLAAGAAHAQDTNTVGNPQLKDFQLPGTRTLPPPTNQEQPAAPADQAAPPPAAEPPAAAPPAAQTPIPPPPATTGTPPANAPAAAARPRLVPRDAAPAQAQPSAPAPAAELPAGVPAPAELEQAIPAPPPAAPKTEWQPPVTPAAAERSFPWLYVGLAALLALLGLLALFALKRSRASGADRVEAEAVPQPIAPGVDPAPGPDPLFAARGRPKNAPLPAEPAEPATSPAGAAAVPAQAAPPAAAAAPSGIVGVSMRPRIELEFKANRAAATLTEAVVQYELIVRNAGNSAAQNVRLQAFMTNAGPEQDEEIGNFFSQSSLKEEPVAIPSLAPGTEAHVRSGLSLPRDQLREITVQGRRLFIPIVAFNVYYEWGQDRSGQTSMSYLVGREAPTPQEKMGAFRLDLGPRLYRSVGQRQANLAKVV